MFSKLHTAAVTLVLGICPSIYGQAFLSDDPMPVDRDNVIDVGEPLRMRLSDYYDFLQHTFSTPGDLSRKRSLNANTIGEVPDSSWFQNRHGQRRMSRDELVRGPNQGDGPSTSGPWAVIEGKTEGVTPGFRIRDSRGDVYVIKFDPPSNPEMATSAEVISTKFFYAAGYNVPENYLVFFDRSSLVVDPDARISIGLGSTRRMTASDLDQILTRVTVTPEGRYRAVASKLLAGRALGPFKYYGVRPDDPNDVIAHEQRRELRGLGVISAWLNHDDSRAVNTLDMVEAENGRSFIRHYLIDFGSTLGSGSVTAQKPRAGWEYIWEPKPVFRRIFTLGLWDSSWIRIRYPRFASVGRFESKEFEPEKWKPEYPNPAFLNARPDDAYWGAKIVTAFTDDDIRSVVRAGALSDSPAEEYLTRSLIDRRDAIGREYFKRVLALDEFTVDSGKVTFANLASQRGFVPNPSQYTVSWFRFDNEKETRTIVGSEAKISGFEAAIPNDLLRDSSAYFGLQIFADDGSGGVDRSHAVSVVVQRTPRPRIVGVDRTWSEQ